VLAETSGLEPVPSPPGPPPDGEPPAVPSPVGPTPAPSPIPISTCADITDITLRGKDFTKVVQTVCNVWPKDQFGAFPANTVGQLNQILGQVFNAGGLWDKLQAVVGEKSSRYCLRREVMRYELTAVASESNCPPVLTEDRLDELPDELAKHAELSDGYWACGNGTQSNCDCRKRDLESLNTPFPVVSISSQPSGCQMVHAGKCYGSCPSKYRPTFLKGWFRPVCTSVCAETNFPVTCGVGCANSRMDCVAIILNQVKEIAISASKIAAFFMTGSAGVIFATAVEQVVKVAEFAFNVLAKVLEIADAAYKQFTREQAEMATLISLYQVLKETAADVAKDWLTFQGYIRESGALFVRLIDANFGWKNIDLGWITGAIMKEGLGALTGAFQVARAFAYAKCELADDEVHFTIEHIGDQRLIGAWSKDGTANGKPRYRIIRNRENTMLEWSRRSNSWAIWYLDKSFGSGWWFGWLGMGWRELYETKSPTPEFPKSGWRKIEGSLPLPQLVSAKNGGE